MQMCVRVATHIKKVLAFFGCNLRLRNTQHASTLSLPYFKAHAGGTVLSISAMVLTTIRLLLGLVATQLLLMWVVQGVVVAVWSWHLVSFVWSSSIATGQENYISIPTLLHTVHVCV